MQTNRRQLLNALALVGVAGGTSAFRMRSTLSDDARFAGLRFGTAMREASIDDGALNALVRAQCSSLTPELSMKWAAIAPQADMRVYDDADRLAAYATANALAMRGHTLLWHAAIPDWFDRTTPWSIVSHHITELVTRYRHVVDEWDVVNEPVVAGGLRRSAFFENYGGDYIERAFSAAHAAAPEATLVLNEYDIEYATPDQADRRAALLGLIRDLVRKGAPIHGLGIQAHLKLGMQTDDFGPFSDFLDAVTDLGLSLSITEFDVKEWNYILPAHERDMQVADHAARFLDVVLKKNELRSLTCWGLSDRQSWLELTAEDYARFPNAWQDGTGPGLNRGLPYDAALVAKPLRDVIASMLARRTTDPTIQG